MQWKGTCGCACVRVQIVLLQMKINIEYPGFVNLIQFLSNPMQYMDSMDEVFFSPLPMQCWEYVAMGCNILRLTLDPGDRNGNINTSNVRTFVEGSSDGILVVGELMRRCLVQSSDNKNHHVRTSVEHLSHIVCSLVRIPTARGQMRDAKLIHLLHLLLGVFGRMNIRVTTPLLVALVSLCEYYPSELVQHGVLCYLIPIAVAPLVQRASGHSNGEEEWSVTARLSMECIHRLSKYEKRCMNRLFSPGVISLITTQFAREHTHIHTYLSTALTSVTLLWDPLKDGQALLDHAKQQSTCHMAAHIPHAGTTTNDNSGGAVADDTNFMFEYPSMVHERVIGGVYLRVFEELNGYIDRTLDTQYKPIHFCGELLSEIENCGRNKRAPLQCLKILINNHSHNKSTNEMTMYIFQHDKGISTLFHILNDILIPPVELVVFNGAPPPLVGGSSSRFTTDAIS